MSQIAPNNINGNFPVYGQDNPTQGFRDNFTNIKNNFTIAKTEIEDLQDKAILKSPLIGTVLDNDLNGSILTNPQLRAWTQAFIDLGSLAGPTDIDFDIGNFQKITTQGNVEVNIVNWPASQGVGVTGYAVMRVWFVVTDVTHTIQLPPEISIGTDDLANFDAVTNSLRFDLPGNFVFDISSADGGQNYLIFDLTRNRVRFRDPSFYYNPDVSPTLIIGFTNDLPTAVATSTGVNTVTIRGTINSYSGVRDRGNTPGVGVYGVYAQNEALSGNTGIGGYSISATRGYVDPDTGLFTQDSRSLVANNDYIGRINFIGGSLDTTTFPGSFTPAFCEFATIRSFVTGYVGGGQLGNLVPGGNLVIMTKKDGILNPGTGYIHRALSVENDQSTHFYGAQTSHGAEVSSGYQYQDLDASVEIPVSVDTPVVLLDSGTSSTIAVANILLPAASKTRDGQRLTIAANCTVSSINFLNSAAATYLDDGYTNGQSLLVVYSNPYIQPGMVAYSPPYYNTPAVVLAVIPDDPAPGISVIVMSANIEANATPTVTSINFYTGTNLNNAPTSAVTGDAYNWIFRSANSTWYKI